MRRTVFRGLDERPSPAGRVRVGASAAAAVTRRRPLAARGQPQQGGRRHRRPGGSRRTAASHASTCLGQYSSFTSKVVLLSARRRWLRRPPRRPCCCSSVLRRRRGRNSGSPGRRGRARPTRVPARPWTSGEDGRQHEQRRERRGDQAADDGPAQRGRLLAALAQAQGHRHHAGDHGAAGHQDRPEPAPAPPRRAAVGRAAPSPAVPLGEGDQQDGVGDRHADGHDRPHERLDVQRRAGQPAARARRRRAPPGAVEHDDQRQPDRLEVGRQQQEDDDDRPAPGRSPGPRNISCIGAIWPRTSTVDPLAAASPARAMRLGRRGRRPGPGPRRRCWPSGSPSRCML